MFLPRLRFIALTSLVLVAFQLVPRRCLLNPGAPHPGSRHRPHRKRLTCLNPRRRVGCSSRAACSTQKENRCQRVQYGSCAEPLDARECWDCRERVRVRSPADRRWLGPVPNRRTSHVIVRIRVVRRVCPGARLWRGWVELDADAEQPAADISLRTERVIHGRLFDLQGRPVPDVTISVGSITRVSLQDSAKARERPQGVMFTGPVIHDSPGWPKPVLTDGEGRFAVSRCGPRRARNPRCSSSAIRLRAHLVRSSCGFGVEAVDRGAGPAQILNVRVTYADTGEPVPHAPLEVMASQGGPGGRPSSRPTPREDAA